MQLSSVVAIAYPFALAYDHEPPPCELPFHDKAEDVSDSPADKEQTAARKSSSFINIFFNYSLLSEFVKRKKPD